MGGMSPLTALLSTGPDVLMVGSAVNGPRSVLWAVQGGPGLCCYVQTVLLCSVGCEEGLRSSVSSSCELWVFELALEICLGPSPCR